MLNVPCCPFGNTSAWRLPRASLRWRGHSSCPPWLRLGGWEGGTEQLSVGAQRVSVLQRPGVDPEMGTTSLTCGVSPVARCLLKPVLGALVCSREERPAEQCCPSTEGWCLDAEAVARCALLVQLCWRPACLPLPPWNKRTSHKIMYRAAPCVSVGPVRLRGLETGAAAPPRGSRADAAFPRWHGHLGPRAGQRCLRGAGG